MSSTESQIQINVNPEENMEHRRMQMVLLFEGYATDDITGLKAVDGDCESFIKSLLPQHSKYFEKMFECEHKEYNKNLVYMREVDSLVLKGFFNYITTNEIPAISLKNAEEILYGAQLLLLDDLRDECIDFLTSSINNKNCLVIKNIAVARSIECLTVKCTQYVLRNFNSVSRRPEFLDISLEYISELTQSLYLFVDRHEDIFKAIMRWVKHDPNIRKDYLPELFLKAKLGYLPQSYVIKLLKDPLIEEDEQSTEIIKDLAVNFSVKFEKAILEVTTEIVDQKVKRIVDPKKIRLPQIKGAKLDSPCFGETVVDIVGTLDFIKKYEDIEWTVALDENNFLRAWDAKWKDLKADF